MKKAPFQEPSYFNPPPKAEQNFTFKNKLNNIIFNINKRVDEMFKMNKELKEIEILGSRIISHLIIIYHKKISKSSHPYLAASLLLLSIPFAFFVSFVILPYFGI